MLKIHLRWSKCDQFGRGVDVYVGRTSNELCPVATTLAYFAVQGGAKGPLFIDTQRRPVTKERFVRRMREVLREVLREAGYEAFQFAGYSFLIGAATTAAKVDVEDSVIHALGCWHSADAQGPPGQNLSLPGILSDLGTWY